MQKTSYSQGFSLVEIMVVLVIIAVLCTLALPNPSAALARSQVGESLALIDDFKILAVAHYKLAGEFPSDNKKLGIPKAELLVGNFVTRIDLEKGAFHIYFGNKAGPAIKDKILSIRPVVVKGSPESPTSWVCGYSAVPENMEAVGENKTSIETKFLPTNCRI